MNPFAVTHGKMGDGICSSQQLSSLSCLVGPGTCPAPWTGPEGTSCKRRTSKVHQVRSAVPSIHPSGCHLRTGGHGEREGDGQYLHPSPATQLWQPIVGGLWSLLSPCDSSGAPHSSFVELHPEIPPQHPPSPAPAGASAQQHCGRAGPFSLHRL